MDTDTPFAKTAVSIMSWAERIVVLLVGLALFVVAAALIIRTLAMLPLLFTTASDLLLSQAGAVLNNILLVLMLIELAYTAMLSLRGVMLNVEPFLIVGLIATVRRILVITIGEGRGPSPNVNELYVLIALLLAFAASIFVLNLRTRTRARLHTTTSPTVVGEIHSTR